MPIFLKMDGVTGSATTDGHVGEVELGSFQFGAGVGWGTPQGGNRSRSAPSISEISVTKEYDDGTEGLLKELLTGKGDKTATIFFTAASGGTIDTYLEYVLTNCAVSGYSVTSGGDFPSEVITLNFTKIEIKWSGRDAKNAANKKIINYDLELQKKV